MRNYITFAGKSLKDYGVYISGSGTFKSPERDTTKISIPGRNGDLTLDNGRYKNVPVEYPAFVVKKFGENVAGLREYLLSLFGYQRLEDTYNTDEYRMAKYSGGFSPKALDDLTAGEFKLTFDCMPQRFLKDGENYISVSNGSVLLNPTRMTAKPLIKMTTGSSVTASAPASLSVGGIQVLCTRPTTVIFLDCDLQEAYNDFYTNMNDKITLVHGVFPTLPAGESGIYIANCTVEIMPRWWRI